MTGFDQRNLNPRSASNWSGLSVFVDGDIHDFSLGHAHSLMGCPGAFCFYCYANGDGRVTDVESLGIEADEVSNENRGDEFDFVHGGGHQLPVRMLVRFHRTGQVEGTEDDTTKNSAQVVGVTRHHDNANGGLETARLKAR